MLAERVVIIHESLDFYGTPAQIKILRSFIVTTGALHARDEGDVTLEVWIGSTAEQIDRGEYRRPFLRFARWFHLRQARLKALTESQLGWRRRELILASRFLHSAPLRRVHPPIRHRRHRCLARRRDEGQHTNTPVSPVVPGQCHQPHRAHPGAAHPIVAEDRRAGTRPADYLPQQWAGGSARSDWNLRLCAVPPWAKLRCNCPPVMLARLTGISGKGCCMARGDIGQPGTQSPGPGSELMENRPKGSLKSPLMSPRRNAVWPWRTTPAATPVPKDQLQLILPGYMVVVPRWCSMARMVMSIVPGVRPVWLMLSRTRCCTFSATWRAV